MRILIDGRMGQELRARGLNTDAKVAGLAIIKSPEAVRVAGCLPPLRARYEPNHQDPVSMGEEYTEIASHLAPGVDLFICETMASASEAAAAARAAAAYGKPVRVSWTLRDECDGLLRSGETLDQALAALGSTPVEALLFNCSDAVAIVNAMPLLRAITKQLICVK